MEIDPLMIALLIGILWALSHPRGRTLLDNEA